jgi:hypothetical protein
MKTKEEIFQKVCGFGFIGENESITLTKELIYEAMEEYKQQETKEVCKCEPHCYYTWEMEENKCQDCGGWIFEK